ncbi:MAG: glycosyltransferase family 9 protein [Bacteroidales bacterium]|nr:glycosyltransferase family 9 protein [Bacteroidales bacterium]
MIQNPPKRFLIIRFSSIGDMVLTSPIIRCLKLQIPEAEIHYLTKKQYLPLIEANPYIEKTWGYDHNFKEIIPQLKSQGFDQVIDLHKNYRSAFVKNQLSVSSASFPKLNFRKWLIVRFKINILPPLHIVDRYFKAVEKLGVKNDGNGLDYFIPEKDEIDLHTLPEILHHGFVSIVIGGKHNTKIFPEEKVIEISRKISLPIMLLGGEGDHERGETIAQQVGSRIVNGCGRFTLNQSASLIRQSQVVLANDTGLMHIAAAFKKRIVSVWGNTIPDFGMFPYLPHHAKNNSYIAEVHGLSCRPCSKLGFQSCPKKHFRCMNDIDITPIVNFINAK